MTPFQQHCQTWKDGCGSVLCERANKIVLCRGVLPCDILFVGEAPGDSEDVLGRPFVGPAGHLLNAIIGRALKGPLATLRLAFTNMVGCMPRDEDGKKGGEPDVDSIMQCAPRLQEMVDVAAPRMIVCVGSISRDWLKRGYKNPVTIPTDAMMVDIVHPAAILKANISQRGLMAQRCEITLRDAAHELWTLMEGKR